MVKISDELKDLAKLFKRYGITLYIVGGYVRDGYLGIENKVSQDIDLCSYATPLMLDKIFRNSDYELDELNKELGVMLIYGKNRYEHATFRKEVYSNDRHNPNTVAFIKNIEEDADRRDFKIDAIYYDILEEKYVDPLGGIEDLKQKIITTVKPAKIVLNDDPERILRLIRISTSLGFTIPDDEKKYAKENAYKVQYLSRGRIRKEFDKILLADGIYPDNPDSKNAHYRAFELLAEFDILKFILPKINNIRKDKIIGLDGDLLYNSILKHFKASHQSIRLAVLFLDIVNFKKMTKKKKDFDINKYVDQLLNQSLGEEGLNYPADVIENIKNIMKGYYFYKTLFMTNKQVRRFIFDNIGAIEEIIDMKRTINTNAKDTQKRINSVQLLRSTYKQMKEEKVVFNIDELDIKGEELIRRFPKIKLEKLDDLMKDIAGKLAETQGKNEKENLIVIANKLINSKQDIYLES